VWFRVPNGVYDRVRLMIQYWIRCPNGPQFNLAYQFDRNVELALGGRPDLMLTFAAAPVWECR
jgi:hypothetical protein